MSRKPIICANFKLNHLLEDTNRYIKKLLGQIPLFGNVEVVIAPVATTLTSACQLASGSALKIAAQNLFYEAKGAFTGEWSVAHIQELGCTYAIVGHSERRRYFGETDLVVGKKVKACFDGQIVPIACVGETIEERTTGIVEKVLAKQVDAILSAVKQEQTPNLVLAYEPVWAIGTGMVASLQQIEEAHLMIREIVGDKFGPEIANQVRVVYGGSVNPANAKAIFAQSNVDGGLIGSASLDVDSFCGIISVFSSPLEGDG